MSILSLDPGVSLVEPAAPCVVPDTARLGRRAERAERAAAPRGRRASTTSTASPAVLARTTRLVAVRALGTSAAAAAVTLALAAKGAADTPAELAASGIRGLAAAAIICAAWGFQDRPRLGSLTTTRAWAATALLLALAHAAWFATTLPGTGSSRLGVTAAAFVFDVVLVAVPALLGARAGRPEVHPVI
ncbi:MAG TPA: hypothetical protein VMT69_12005 [Kineosporiaceae bacterium]|nr:hypothetical protein [Kineosporiaceae bacterium]